MSSIVKDELDNIKSFAESTEKRRSKLTLNELNYISDKQLHQKSSGGGDSSVGLAMVTLLSSDLTLSAGEAFYNTSFVFYYPEVEEDSLPPTVTALSSNSLPFSNWNTMMEAGIRIVIPQDFTMNTDRYEYEIEGAAEIISEEGIIHITGDCTIMVTTSSQS